MSRQDKATTERNAKTLRDLVRQGDNKHCADCKKNDARWASWNLGVFLCIRCSGIHRSMGTHISKVKSIDLDIWQPEQLESIKQWGNKRANVYWEAHLKPGHIPPDHKIESFIRSKYESRKWVLSDRIPRDPRVLDDVAAGGRIASEQTEPVQQQQQQQQPRYTDTRTASRPQPNAPTSVPPPIQRHHPLLSTGVGRTKAAPQVDLLSGDQDVQHSPLPTQKPNADSNTTTTSTITNASTAKVTTPGLFDLDFRPPSQPPAGQQRKANQDIMSLFNTAPISPPIQQQQQQQQPQSVGFSGFGNQTAGPTSPGLAPPLASPPYQPTQQQTSSPVSGRGQPLAHSFAGLNFESDPWSSTAQQQPQPAATQSANAHANSNHNNSNMYSFSSQDVWGGGSNTTTGTSAKPLEDDPFQNIWK